MDMTMFLPGTRTDVRQMAGTTTPRRQKSSVPASGGRLRAVPARLALFYRQVVAELRKVVWPSRDQLRSYVYVVITFVVVMMVLVYGADWVFVKITTSVFG